MFFQDEEGMQNEHVYIHKFSLKFRVAIRDLALTSPHCRNSIFASSIFETIIAHSQVSSNRQKLWSFTWNFNCRFYQLELKLLIPSRISPRERVFSRLNCEKHDKAKRRAVKVIDCRTNYCFSIFLRSMASHTSENSSALSIFICFSI